MPPLPGRPASADWGDEALFWGSSSPCAARTRPAATTNGAFSAGGGSSAACRPSPARPKTLEIRGRHSSGGWCRRGGASCGACGAFHPRDGRSRRGSSWARSRRGSRNSRRISANGTIHLLVASGTNVAFVLGLVAPRAVGVLPVAAGDPGPVDPARFLLRLPRRGRRAGHAPCRGHGRRRRHRLLLGQVDRPVHLIGFSALILLALDPGQFFRRGFQMSYAATLGLALGMPAVEAGFRRAESFPGWPARGWRRRFLEGGIGLFAAGFLAQLALAPLLIFYFRRLSWVAPFANLAAVPWGELCLTSGAVLFAFDLTGFPGGGLAAAATDKAARGLWQVAAWAAKVPGAEGSLPWSGGRIAVLSLVVAGTFILLSLVPRVRERTAAPALEPEEVLRFGGALGRRGGPRSFYGRRSGSSTSSCGPGRQETPSWRRALRARRWSTPVPPRTSAGCWRPSSAKAVPRSAGWWSSGAGRGRAKPWKKSVRRGPARDFLRAGRRVHGDALRALGRGGPVGGGRRPLARRTRRRAVCGGRKERFPLLAGREERRFFFRRLGGRFPPSARPRPRAQENLRAAHGPPLDFRGRGREVVGGGVASGVGAQEP